MSGPENHKTVTVLELATGLDDKGQPLPAWVIRAAGGTPDLEDPGQLAGVGGITGDSTELN